MKKFDVPLLVLGVSFLPFQPQARSLADLGVGHQVAVATPPRTSLGLGRTRLGA